MKAKHNPRVFFDIDIEGQPAGRIVFELFADKCPKTCENFRCLCTGEMGKGATTGKPLHYKNVIFHRVIHDFMLQGGDFSEGNGRGGESIYGGYFDDECFKINHDKPFLLSMANRGKNTNGSQFFITTQVTPHLDGKHVVFGRVVDGEAVVKQVESQKTDTNSRPLKECKISHCGELVLASKQKKPKKPKESVSSDDSAQSSAAESNSDDEKTKKKKKKRKHKKEKKKHKKKHKKAKESEDEPAETEPTPFSSITPEEVPEIPENKFLQRTTPNETSDATPDDRRSRQWTTRSGRKIKGRGALRYRTPPRSRSRSRSPRYRGRFGSRSRRDRTGSETPPHWREAERGQHRMENQKKLSGDEETSAGRWRQTSPSTMDNDRSLSDDKHDRPARKPRERTESNSRRDTLQDHFTSSKEGKGERDKNGTIARNGRDQRRSRERKMSDGHRYERDRPRHNGLNGDRNRDSRRERRTSRERDRDGNNERPRRNSDRQNDSAVKSKVDKNEENKPESDPEVDKKERSKTKTADAASDSYSDSDIEEKKDYNTSNLLVSNFSSPSASENEKETDAEKLEDMNVVEDEIVEEEVIEEDVAIEENAEAEQNLKNTEIPEPQVEEEAGSELNEKDKTACAEKSSENDGQADDKQQELDDKQVEPTEEKEDPSNIGNEIAAMESIQDEVVMLNVTETLGDHHEKEGVDIAQEMDKKHSEETAVAMDTNGDQETAKVVNIESSNAAEQTSENTKNKEPGSDKKSAKSERRSRDRRSRSRRRSRSHERRRSSRDRDRRNLSRDHRRSRSRERRRSRDRRSRSRDRKRSYLSRDRRRSRSRDRRRSRSRNRRSSRSRDRRRSRSRERRRSRSRDRRRSRSRDHARRGCRSRSRSPRRRSRSRSRDRRAKFTSDKKSKYSKDDSSSSSSSSDEDTPPAKRAHRASSSSSSSESSYKENALHKVLRPRHKYKSWQSDDDFSDSDKRSGGRWSDGHDTPKKKQSKHLKATSHDSESRGLGDGYFGPAPFQTAAPATPVKTKHKKKNKHKKKRSSRDKAKTEAITPEKTIEIVAQSNFDVKSKNGEVESKLPAEPKQAEKRETSVDIVKSEISPHTMLKSKWDSSDSDMPDDVPKLKDGSVSTGVSNTPNLSPEGGKVLSGVVGMEKLLALKSMKSVKHLKRKHKKSKEKAKAKDKNGKQNKSASASDKEIRSPARKRRHRSNRKQTSSESEKEDILNFVKQEPSKEQRTSVRSKRRSNRSSERSDQYDWSRKRSYSSKSMSSQSSYSTRRKSRSVSSGSYDSRRSRSHSAFSSKNSFRSRSGSKHSSDSSRSSRSNSMSSNASSSASGSVHNFTTIQEVDMFDSSPTPCHVKQAKQKVKKTNKQKKTRDRKTVEVKSGKGRKNKEADKVLSWQPPLEFGEEEDTDEIVLKKDRVKQVGKEKVTEDSCPSVPDPEDVQPQHEISSAKVSQQEKISVLEEQKVSTQMSFSPHSPDELIPENHQQTLMNDLSSKSPFNNVKESNLVKISNTVSSDLDNNKSPDIDDIDRMLSLGEEPVAVKSNRSKLELRKRISLLQKVGLNQNLKEAIAVNAKATEKTEVNNNEVITPINNSLKDTPGKEPEENTYPNSEGSTAHTGFGFMPKFQPKQEIPPSVQEEPMEVSPVRDVHGIWSDDDTDKVHQDKNSKTNVVRKVSKVVKEAPVLVGKTNEQTNDEDVESDDDGELLVHGNVPAAKKPFVFNIKLSAPQPEPLPVGSKPKKKKSKKHKKHKSNKPAKDKTEPEKPVEPPKALEPTTTTATMQAAPSVSAQAQTSMANAMYMRQQMSMYQQQQYYHPMYQQYMHSYHMQYSMHNPYMQYGARQPPLPSGGHEYNPPLPVDQEPPPLPVDDERPPEPVTDAKRLNDAVITAMLSTDVTDENLKKLFNSSNEEPPLPSPASSRSPSPVRSRRKSRRQKEKKRSHRRHSSSASSYTSSRSRSYRSRSDSSYDSSYSRGRSRRRKQSRRSGRSRSFSDRSRSSSYESSGRSRSRTPRRRRSRSRSYDSSSSLSSRSSRDRSSSWSSGSDLDRPCRHYRRQQQRLHGRQPKSSDHYSSSDSDARSWSSRSRGRSRRRDSRSWSRSPSRSSYYTD